MKSFHLRAHDRLNCSVHFAVIELQLELQWEQVTRELILA